MIVILGPTASGKTRLATRLALRIRGEIVSADSRQVYRDMTIGTGKDLDEYQIEGQAVPYHLIDILDAGEKYNVHRFQQDATRIIGEIGQRNRIPILCGGSGLYIQALLREYQYTGVPVDNSLRAELEQQDDAALRDLFQSLGSPYTPLADISTRKRTIRAIEIARFLSACPGFDLPVQGLPRYQVFGLNPPVEIRRERISQRLFYRLENGLLQEVQTLLDRGILPEKLIYYGLEYKFVTEHLTGHLSFDAMVQQLETEIHRFAKRQMTYFRKMERDGIAIHWLPQNQRMEEWVKTIVPFQI
jgi:tRNA dimethylallyltransferase